MRNAGIWAWAALVCLAAAGCGETPTVGKVAQPGCCCKGGMSASKPCASRPCPMRAGESRPCASKPCPMRAGESRPCASKPCPMRAAEPAVTLEQAKAIYEAGLVLQRRGDVEGAVEKYRLAILADYVPVINHLAWLECTYPIEKYLNPPQALELSLRAYKLAVHPDKPTKLAADVTDTVAAAYARMGRYDKAVEFADKAIAMAQELRPRHAVSYLTAHRELYAQHKPFSDLEQLKNHREQE